MREADIRNAVSAPVESALRFHTSELEEGLHVRIMERPARAGAYFSIKPFVGAALSILFLGDRLTLGFGMAVALMGGGVWLHLTERHEPDQYHGLLEHEHRHSHDAHHQPAYAQRLGR